MTTSRCARPQSFIHSFIHPSIRRPIRHPLHFCSVRDVRFARWDLRILHQLLQRLGHTLLEPSVGMSLLSSLATGSQLSLRLQLSRTVRVLHLGLSKDDVAVASRGLVDFGAGDDEEDVAGSSEGDSLDALDALETETFESLPGLALGAGVELDGGAGGDFGLVRDVEVLDGHGGCVCGWGCFKNGLATCAIARRAG